MATKKAKKEVLSDQFLKIMTKNMWQFFNLDTMSSVLQSASAGCRHIKIESQTLNNDLDKKKRMRNLNTVFFKGNMREGHYSFVDNSGLEWGTYEMNLIFENDDGICHGAALTAALHSCGIRDINELISNPNNYKDILYNYIQIIRTYITIINNGWWDTALINYFWNDINEISFPAFPNIKTVQSSIALKELIEFLEKLINVYRIQR